MRRPLTLNVEETLVKKIKKIGIDKNKNVSTMFEDWIRVLK